MDKKDDNDSEWAVGDGGSGGNHKINFWANDQQRNCLLANAHPQGRQEYDSKDDGAGDDAQL
jgi:hypothetical protein